MPTANEYMDAIQQFLEERFGEDEGVADFFVNEHPTGGVAANIMIRADFDTDYVKQINVVIVPDIPINEETLAETKDPFEAARSVF